MRRFSWLIPALIVSASLGCNDFSATLGEHCDRTEGFSCASDADCCAGYSCALGQCVGATGHPATPTALNASELKPTSFMASWNAVERADLAGYTLKWRRSDQASETATSVFIQQPTTGHTLSGLEPERTYALTLQALTTKGLVSAPSSELTVTTLEPTPPVLLASEPPTGSTGVAVNLELAFQFSEAIDPGSLLVSTVPPINLGMPVWADGDRLLLYRDVSQLAYQSLYRIELSATDLAGNALGTQQVTFTTVGPPDTQRPTIEDTLPAHGAIGVPLMSSLQINFSEPMDPESLAVVIYPPVELGETVVDEQRTSVSWEPPDGGFAELETYQYTVSGRDLAQNELSGTLTRSFQTADVTPPSVSSNSPPTGASGIPVTTNISINFSKEMDVDTAQPAFSLKRNGTTVVSGTFQWDGAKRLMTFDPGVDLAFSSSYSVTVTAAATDSVGNALQGQHSFSFTTASAPDTTAPTITAVTPVQGAIGVSRTTNFSVTFSEPVDKASAQQAFGISSPAGFNAGYFSWDATGKVLTFNPDATFAYGVNVSWSVNTAVKDLAGNAMAATANRSFRVLRSGTSTLYAVPALDGYLYRTSSGTVTAVTTSTPAYVGDTSIGTSYRSYFSFDLGALPTTTRTVSSATMTLTRSATYGDIATLGYLYLEHVIYGSSLTSADWGVVAEAGCMTSTTCICKIGCPPTRRTMLQNGATLAATVSGAVQSDWAQRSARGNRSQFRVRTSSDTTSNGATDYISLYTAETSTTASRPKLVVDYEYD